MEWVETTAKTVDDARDAALDQLGVGADEAEIEIVEEPKAGLFGRMRGEARLRARVKPTPARAKNDRRRRQRGSKRQDGRSTGPSPQDDGPAQGEQRPSESDGGSAPTADRSAPATTPRGRTGARDRSNQPEQQESQMSTDDHNDDVTPEQVGEAAVAFMDGLTGAFGADARCDLAVDGTELELSVTGSDLGLLIGSGGRTLNAIQDLARVAAQRRLGDHETRLRIDVAGYRERRQEALARFARDVATQVRDSGAARSMEPMNSSDRKVIHDVLNEEDGVTSRSEGEDPERRIIVLPAD